MSNVSSSITLYTEYDQEIEVSPNYDGDPEKHVRVSIKDGDKTFVFYADPSILQRLAEASKIVLDFENKEAVSK